VLKGYFRVSKVVFDSWYWSEKLVKDNVVSELKSNRRLLRVESVRGTLEEVEGHLRVGDLPPGVYYADLTLRDRVTTVKLLVQEYKGDSGTHVRYLYTTDLSLSEEEIEEAWRMRWEIEELHRDVKALGTGGLLVLEEREASGLPHDLHHHGQRCQGAGGGS
jgi:Archaeal putative transposase ISC1217.